MKKIVSLLIFVCFSIALFSQTNNISVYVYVPEQTEEVPESSITYLSNTLCEAATTDGLAAQTDYVTQFLLVPKVNSVTKNILANTQQQIVLTLDVFIQVVDNLSGTIYASEVVSLKGVGTNATKAYNMAFRSLNKNHTQIKTLISKAKKKVIEYYNSEGENIIKRAQLLAKQRKFDEAFYLLSMIPSQSNGFDMATSASLNIWGEYEKYACSINLGKARSVWLANQDIDAANMAGMYLATVLPDSPCYNDAVELYKDIKAKVGELWNFEMKLCETENDLRLAKIQAIQNVGVAFGKGQQPGMIIHKSKY